MSKGREGKGEATLRIAKEWNREAWQCCGKAPTRWAWQGNGIERRGNAVEKHRLDGHCDGKAWYRADRTSLAMEQ